MIRLFIILLIAGLTSIGNQLLAQETSDSNQVAPPPPPSPVFTIVEKMPVFGDCDTTQEIKMINECSNQNVSEYIVKNVVYPKKAKKDNIQGVVYCSFVVNKDGAITDVKVLKGVTGGEILNEEAVRVISTMPNWLPGTQRGKRVKVQYTIPVRFKLK